MRLGMNQKVILAGVLLVGGCQHQKASVSSVDGAHNDCRFRTMDLKIGMNREQVEEKVAAILGKQDTYSPYGNNLQGGTVQYRDGNCVLAVTYKAGAPAPWVDDGQGHVVHYPPIDETVFEYKIFRETPDQRMKANQQ